MDLACQEKKLQKKLQMLMPYDYVTPVRKNREHNRVYLLVIASSFYEAPSAFILDFDYALGQFARVQQGPYFFLTTSTNQPFRIINKFLSKFMGMFQFFVFSHSLDRTIPCYFLISF
jgi:hypothetical protein